MEDVMRDWQIAPMMCAASPSRCWASSAFIPRIVAVDLSQGGATLQMKLS
jgi:hypothetical protein